MGGNRTMAGCETMPRSAAGSSVSFDEGVDAAEAARAGFRSIEHLGPGDSIWIGCSTEEAVLLRDAAQHAAMKTPPIPIPAFVVKMLMKRLQKRL